MITYLIDIEAIFSNFFNNKVDINVDQVWSRIGFVRPHNSFRRKGNAQRKHIGFIGIQYRVNGVFILMFLTFLLSLDEENLFLGHP